MSQEQFPPQISESLRKAIAEHNPMDWGAVPSDIVNEGKEINYLDKLKAAESFDNGYRDTPESSGEGQHSVAEDIFKLNETRTASMREQLVDKVLENEMLGFFQEHNRFMNSKERKVTRKSIEKMVAKGQIYINDVGKMVVRKGSNVTPPKKKRKK